MRRKKADDTDKNDPQEALEQRVDAMMSIEAPAFSPAKVSEPEPEKAAEPDLEPEPAESQTTAPQLPSQLLKTLGKTGKTSTLKIVKSEPAEEGPAETPDDPAEASPDADTIPPGDPLEDSATDSAVDDIMAKEADMQLAVDDAVARRQAAEAETPGPGLLHRFFTSPWTWLFIIGTAGIAYAWYHTSL